ncbi:MAG: hypothetical protein ACI9XZ_002385 [Alphaproteobacteria bacterium]
MNAAGIDEAIVAARGVMTAHFTALNARDEDALAATLHFPHHRLSGGALRTWDGPDAYFGDFLARAGDGWKHSTLDSVDVFAADADKVHLDVRFTRYRTDDSELGSFRSLWVIAKLKDCWAAQLRSSFAA